MPPYLTHVLPSHQPHPSPRTILIPPPKRMTSSNHLPHQPFLIVITRNVRTVLSNAPIITLRALRITHTHAMAQPSNCCNMTQTDMCHAANSHHQYVYTTYACTCSTQATIQPSSRSIARLAIRTRTCTRSRSEKSNSERNFRIWK